MSLAGPSGAPLAIPGYAISVLNQVITAPVFAVSAFSKKIATVKAPNDVIASNDWSMYQYVKLSQGSAGGGRARWVLLLHVTNHPVGETQNIDPAGLADFVYQVFGTTYGIGNVFPQTDKYFNFNNFELPLLPVGTSLYLVLWLENPTGVGSAHIANFNQKVTVAAPDT